MMSVCSLLILALQVALVSGKVTWMGLPPDASSQERRLGDQSNTNTGSSSNLRRRVTEGGGGDPRTIDFKDYFNKPGSDAVKGDENKEDVDAVAKNNKNSDDDESDEDDKKSGKLIVANPDVVINEHTDDGKVVVSASNKHKKKPSMEEDDDNMETTPDDADDDDSNNVNMNNKKSMASSSVMADESIKLDDAGSQDLISVSSDKHHQNSHPKPPHIDKSGSNTRKFISYQSSDWELMWLDNVEQWSQSDNLCKVLLNEQASIVHDFLNMTCTSRMPEPHSSWCIINDDFHGLWYNSDDRSDFYLSWNRPPSIPDTIPVPPANMVRPGPEHAHVASRFVFYDQVNQQHYVEYIEPLVSNLRFPIAKCVQPFPGTADVKALNAWFRGWIVPPPLVRGADRMLYFDAGASSWDKEDHGPSLKYFASIWGRHGVPFDSLIVFDENTPSEQFYPSVPVEFQPKTHFKQCSLAKSPQENSDDHPFLPTFIHENTRVNDYVLLKLDMKNKPEVEEAIIQFILAQDDTHVDEILWEHHIRDNMWEQGSSSSLSLRESYEYFIQLRHKGIRAHSWV